MMVTHWLWWAIREKYILKNKKRKTLERRDIFVTVRSIFNNGKSKYYSHVFLGECLYKLSK